MVEQRNEFPPQQPDTEIAGVDPSQFSLARRLRIAIETVVGITSLAAGWSSEPDASIAGLLLVATGSVLLFDAVTVALMPHGHDFLDFYQRKIFHRGTR